jgi:hypothetical protein
MYMWHVLVKIDGGRSCPTCSRLSGSIFVGMNGLLLDKEGLIDVPSHFQEPAEAALRDSEPRL